MSALITDVCVLPLGFSFTGIKSAKRALKKESAAAETGSKSLKGLHEHSRTSLATRQSPRWCTQCHHVWVNEEEKTKPVLTDWAGQPSAENSAELGRRLGLTHCYSEGLKLFFSFQLDKNFTLLSSGEFEMQMDKMQTGILPIWNLLSK